MRLAIFFAAILLIAGLPDVVRAQSMMALLDGKRFDDQGKMLFSSCHPLCWAPYTIIGDGGSGG